MNLQRAGLVAVIALTLAGFSHLGAEFARSGGKSHGGVAPPPYVGPCDVSGVTCVGYYSVAGCAQVAYAGNTVDVVDTATGNTTGTRMRCISGVASALVSASACTFVTGNACSSLATTCAVSCTFSTVYNQMGTVTFPNMTGPAALASRVTIGTSVLLSLPCFQGNGSQWMTSVTTSTLAQPFTIFSESERTGAFTSNQRIAAAGSAGTMSLGYRTTINTVAVLAGGAAASQTASDSAFHNIIGIANAASSQTVVDGSAGTAAGAGSNGWSALALFLMGDSASEMTGAACEIGIASSALNATQYGALNSNMAVRW